MTNEDKALEISKRYFGEPNQVITWQAAMQIAQWKDEQINQLYEIIIKLWDMLDWIDTYSDLKINGSEDDLYFSKIEDKTKERFNLVKSDGYNLFINDEKITNNEHNTTKTD